MRPPKHILPTIVLAQFCCTSLWFASNGVIGDLIANYGLPSSALGQLTSSVQFGFISGTLLFALFTLTDRFSPSRLFFICGILGALANGLMLWPENGYTSLLLFRYFTGFFLAGIYPVGMKIAADYFDAGLGKSLGFLVGALVVGTAFPHFLKGLGGFVSWQRVILCTSLLAVFGGGLVLLLIPNGPYRKQSQKLDFTAFFTVFKQPKFRAAAFGYFGHMWELYSFWAFVPVMLALFKETYGVELSVPFWSFGIIAIGGLACVLGGYLSQQWGAKKTAATALGLSGCCCLLFPWVLGVPSTVLFLAFLCFWGMVVIADSPLFSTLVAQNAIPEFKGTALTIVNGIGFSITIVSILLLSLAYEYWGSPWVFLLLSAGPVLGLLGLFSSKKS